MREVTSAVLSSPVSWPRNQDIGWRRVNLIRHGAYIPHMAWAVEGSDTQPGLAALTR